MKLKRWIFILAGTLMLAVICLGQSSNDVRKIRISFVPPPADGAISLGIFNEWGQLVRVLHQEAELDEFTVGADALVTYWNGKDDEGSEVPAGTYRARGFVVPAPSIKQVESSEPPGAEAASVRLKLVANPLEKNERATVEIAAGFDDENAFIKTADGLPLHTIATTAGTTKTGLTAGRDNKIVTVWLSDGSTTRRFDVTGLEKMMAFDCGELEVRSSN